MQALGRLWTFAWQAVVGYALFIVISIVATIWGLVDIVWQLVTGWNTFSENSTPARWVSITFEWAVGQTLYGLLGAGDGKWRPLPTS